MQLDFPERKAFLRFVFLLTGLFLYVNLSAQVIFQDSILLQKKISLQLVNSSLYKIIQQIEEKYSISFSYSNDLIQLERKLSVRVQDQPLKSVLDDIFKNSSISYKVVGKQIVLFKVQPVNAEVKKDTSAPVTATSPASKDTLHTRSAGRKAAKHAVPEAGDITEGKNKKRGKRDKLYFGLNIEKRDPVSSDTTHTPQDSLLPRKSRSPLNELPVENIDISRYSKKKWAIEFNAGAGSSFRRLKAVGKDGEGIINYRSNERHKVNFSAALMLHYKPVSFLRIEAGIGIVNSGFRGVTHFEDSSRRNDYWRTDFRYRNNYTALTFPVGLAYVQPVKRNMILEIHSGLLPSLSLGRGSDALKYYDYYAYLEYANEPIWSRNTNPPPQIIYRKMNLAYFLTAQAGWRIGTTELLLGPYYVRYIYSSYAASAPLKENMYLYGISGRIRYWF